MTRPPRSITARDDILGMEKKPPTVHTCLESQKECMWSRSTGWKECQLELLDEVKRIVERKVMPKLRSQSLRGRGSPSKTHTYKVGHMGGQSWTSFGE